MFFTFHLFRKILYNGCISSYVHNCFNALSRTPIKTLFLMHML